MTNDIYTKRVFWLDYHYYDVQMILHNKSHLMLANSRQEAEEKTKNMEQSYVITISKVVYYWFSQFM